MRNKLVRLCARTLVLTFALSSGAAFSQTTYGAPPLYGPGQTDRPYDDVRREFRYAKLRADGRYNDNSNYSSSYAQSAFDAMKRAMTYRDKGDMKNACRYATLAVNMLNRAGFDRSWEIVSAYAETQQEFCSAVDA